MPISNANAKLLHEASRTITLIGRLNRNPSHRGLFRFPDAETITLPDGATISTKWLVNAASLFERLRPELRYSYKQELELGEWKFRGILLESPAQTDDLELKSLPLTVNSPLLEPRPSANLDDHVAIQQVGGRLFRDLVGNMTCMAPYGHPNFTRGLTELVLRYVPPALEREPAGAKVASGALQTAIQTSPDIRAAILQLLTCLEDDEPAVRRTVAELFDKSASEAGEGRITAFNPEAAIRTKQIDRALFHLLTLKQDLYRMKGPAIDALKAAGIEWVSPDTKAVRPEPYRFKAPAHGLGAGFAADYRAFREAADHVARFIRCVPLHSFVVCWLSAKYLPHTAATRLDAAKVMFEWGCKKQLYRKIRDTGTALQAQIEAGEAELRKLEEENKEDRDFVFHLGEVKRRFRSSYRFSRAYTRKDLRNIVAELFGSLCQLAGGKVSELHKKSEKLNEELAGIKDALQQEVQAQKEKAAKGSEGVIDRVAAVAAMRKAARTDQGRLAAEEWDKDVEGVKALTPAHAVQRFAAMHARVSGSAFRGDWTAADKVIAEEKEENMRLLSLWLGISVEGSDTQAGDAVNIAVADTLPPVKQDRLEAIRAAHRKATKARVSRRAAARATAPLPDAVRANPAVAAGDREVAAEVRVGNRVVASATIKNGQAEVRRGADAAQVEVGPTDRTTLRVGDGADATEVDVVDTPELAAAVREVAPETDPKLEASLDSFGEKLTLRRKELADKFGESGEANATFRRATLGFDFGRTVLAAPTDSVPLEQDDLSNATGIILHMLRQLGEDKFLQAQNAEGQPVNRAAFKEVEKNGTTTIEVDDGPTRDQVIGINLSEFYPLADADEEVMDIILGYHYELCKNLRTVDPFLREVRELREYFNALERANAQVVFAADRLTDVLEKHPMLCNEEAGWIFYAMRAAFEGAPKDPADASAALGTLAESIGTMLQEATRAQYLRLQIPAVVLADGVTNTNTALNFPVFDSSLSLPELGSTMSSAVVAVGKLVQSKPLLLWATCLLDGAQPADFGVALPAEKQHMTGKGGVNQHLQSQTLPGWVFLDKEASVFNYLRKCLRHADQHKARNQLIVLRWINLGLVTQDGGGALAFIPRRGYPMNGLQGAVLKPLYVQTDPDYFVTVEGPRMELRHLLFGKADSTATGGETLGDAQIQPNFTQDGCRIPGTNFVIQGQPVTAGWVQQF